MPIVRAYASIGFILYTHSTVASSDTDSQGPIFWERLRSLFTSSREEELAPNEPPRNRGMVIAVCVAISFVLWLTFTLQEMKVVTLELPIEVVNVPEEEALSTLPPRSASVQVEGEGVQLLWMYYNTPAIPIDASEQTLNLADALSLPDNVRLQSITPRQVTIEKEPRIERQIPVRVRVRVQTPPAYELIEPPRLQPDSVTVFGAQSIINGLDAWPTDSMTIDGVRDSIQTRVTLADTLARLVTRTPQHVSLIARAAQFAEFTREIEVEVTGVPSGQNVVTLEPSTVRVKYRVLFDQLFASQRAPDFFATVSYDQIRSDTTGYVRPDLNLPADLIIRDPEIIPSRLQYYTFVAGE